MRILFVPILNYPPSLDADSIYLISIDWCRRLCDADPDASVYLVLPPPYLDGDRSVPAIRRFRYKPRKIHDRVHIVEIPMLSRYDLEEANCGFSQYGQFHAILGRYPVDVVIATSAIKMLGMKRLLSSGGASSFPQTFFNFELLIRGLGTNEVSQVSTDEMVMQAAGQQVAHNLFQSPKCLRIAVEAARRFASPTQVKRLIDSSDMVYSGYDDERCFPLPLAERNEQFTVIVRGRLTTSKNIDQILDLYNRFYAAGRNVRVIATTGNAGSVPADIQDEIDKNHQIEWLTCATRDESVDVMRKAHAFCFWSSHELFAVSVWEMLGSGLIGVFRRADWLVGLLPEGYPYVFDTDIEAYTMLADIYENLDARLEEFGWVVRYCQETYSYRSTSPATIGVIRRKRALDQATPRDWLVDILREHGGDGFTMKGAFDLAGQHAQMGKSVLKGANASRLFRAIGPLEMAAAARLAGFTERLECADPEFFRVTNKPESVDVTDRSDV